MRRAEGKPSNALVGFSNFLMRLWQAEEPRAVVVGWDTLTVPTYRHELFDGYQGGREFDDEQRSAHRSSLRRSISAISRSVASRAASD